MQIFPWSVFCHDDDFGGGLWHAAAMIEPAGVKLVRYGENRNLDFIQVHAGHAGLPVKPAVQQIGGGKI